MPAESYRVPGYFVRLLFDYLESRGLDAPALLQEPRPDKYGIGTYSQFQCWSMIRRTQHRLKDPLLGLHLGQSIAIAHLGLFGYLLFNSSTLAEVVLRAGKYFRLLQLNPIKLNLGMEADSFTLEFEIELEQQDRVGFEAAAAALVQLARNVTALPLQAQEMWFMHAAPEERSAYDEYFGCEVRFGQPRIRLRFPLSYLNLKLRAPDPDLAVLLESQADNLLADLPGDPDLGQVVRDCIAELMRVGEPSIEQVAELLHLSPRTLQRRLDENGLNFRTLLDDTRLQLAENYLHDPTLQLKEVAHRLGFSEQSAFSRAFRRWTGTSPREFVRNRAEEKR